MAKNNAGFYDEKKEWSIIKDKLLMYYLKPYFQKLLRTRKTICYIDCFAGMGKFKDGNDGSPLIALKLRKQALMATLSINHPQIDMIFIESKYANDLEQNVNEYVNDGFTSVIHGRFEDKIVNLLRERKGQNIFLYIDPFGINPLDFNIFSMLDSFQFNSIEILLNFNSFGFFRVACSVMGYDASSDKAFQDSDDLFEQVSLEDLPSQREEALARIAGGYYWKSIVSDYYKSSIKDGYQAEERFSDEYKVQLRNHFRYVLDIPLRPNLRRRPKYRLIHACNHPDGCFLMVDNMLKRKKELGITVQQKGQRSFWDNKFSDEGKYTSDEEIKKNVYGLIDAIENKIHLTDFIGSFYGKYGLSCEINTIIDILKKMELARKVSITRKPELTETGRKSSFWNEREGNQVILRRNKI